MYTTEHLLLRELKTSDCDPLRAIWNDPLVQSTGSTTYCAPMSEPRFAAVFRSAAETDMSVLVKAVMETLDTHEIIGVIGLRIPSAKNRDAVVEIFIGRKWWGRKYGTEAMTWLVDHAFLELGMHRVSLQVFGGNERGVRLYEKLGFKVEGTRRKCNWRNGHWEDIIDMAILDEEFEAIHGGAGDQ
ncbi:acyl-CoA N-acyltransferase [Hymenopellis radicata]|nr:acyl-CoA N-acyltransferase [Hymenopellis radicata]